MVKVLVLLLLGIILLGVSITIYNNTHEVSVEKTIGMPEWCNDFNGEDFLLTGGSSNPQTIDEIKFELARLNWLCSGGNR